MRNYFANRSVIIGFTLVTIGLVALIASLGIKLDADGGWGARIFPLTGSSALLVLGALQILEGVVQPPADQQPVPNSISRVVVLLVLSIGYVWTMSKLGYLISTAFVAPLIFILFGVRSRFGLIIAAILCPAVYHLIFFVGLKVFPPLGEWFDLLDLVMV